MCSGKSRTKNQRLPQHVKPNVPSLTLGEFDYTVSSKIQACSKKNSTQVAYPAETVQRIARRSKQPHLVQRPYTDMYVWKGPRDGGKRCKQTKPPVKAVYQY
jgi:hypothetical protein